LRTAEGLALLREEADIAQRMIAVLQQQWELTDRYLDVLRLVSEP
jgi:hypothetical protein